MSKDLRELWQRAKAFAISRKVKPELAEEFAQDVVLERAVSGREEIRLDWRLTDFLRKEQGDLRSEAGRRRAGQTSLDAPLPGTDGELLVGDTVAAPAPKEDHLSQPRWRAPLTAVEERVLDELVDDGVRGAELAAAMGVTQARVSQIFGSAKRKIRDAAVFDELLDDYLRDPERSKLEVSWL